jgi:hypothetical protein
MGGEHNGDCFDPNPRVKTTQLIQTLSVETDIQSSRYFMMVNFIDWSCGIHIN